MMRQSSRRIASLKSVGILLVSIANISFSESSNAQGWDFETLVELGIVYTDNLFLADEGLEEDDYAYRIAPTFTFTKDSETLEADIRYRPEALFFNETSDADDVFHSLDANMTATLARDALFVYASAANYQSIVTPAVQIPTTVVPVTANRVDSQIFEVQPYWEQNLGIADVYLEGRYVATRYDDIDSEFPDFATDNDLTGGRFTLNNFEQGEGIAWGVEYWRWRLEYDESIPWEFQQATANLGYWISSGVRIFAAGGVETPFDALFDSSMDEDLWEVGLQVAPSQRMNLEIAVGERSYGDTYRAEFSYQLRRGLTTLTYSEGPSTQGEYPTDRRPISGPDNLDQLLDRPFATDRFVRRRGEWDTEMEFAKSSLTLRVFSEVREQRTTAIGNPLEDEELRGAAFRFAWNFGDNAALGILADITRRESDLFDDELTRYSIDYTYQFTQRLGIVFLVQQSVEKGLDSTTESYTENQARVTLTARL